ncbi:MAG: histidine phosphatase family protein [Caldilineaceae bacterium]
MKVISIIRHAKAEIVDGDTADFERALTERGRKDARALGKVIDTLKPPLEWIVSSAAKRAAQTSHELIKVLSEDPKLVLEGRIYGADVNTLLSVLTETPSGIEHAALVGHNPILEELISGLCCGDSHPFPVTLATATLAQIELEIFSWDQLRWGCGRLNLLLPAKVVR